MKLIAGIDPGTTVGWALLDLAGKVVAFGSRKELDLDSLISIFTKHGRIILVGSDKAKLPSFVQEAATKLGAKVVSPSQDLRVDEKREMTEDIKWNNAHEMDALASSFVAFRKVHPLLKKINSFLLREQKLGLFEDVVEIVLKEEISIHSAMIILTPKEVVHIEENKEEQKRDEDVSRLYSLLTQVRKDNALLLKKNRELERRSEEIAIKYEQLEAHAAQLVKPKAPEVIVKEKESRIQSLSQKLENSVAQIKVLREQIEQLQSTLLLLDDFIALPRLKRLGWEDVSKLKIKEGDILFVDDPNQVSDKAVDFLHSKNVQLIICKKPAGEKLKARLPFACVQAFDAREFEHVVLVKKSWLENVRKERYVLAKIIQEYKKERSTA
jgi:hypothetical protein